MDQAAVFGSLTWYVGDRQSLSGGLRFSAIDTRLPEVGVIPAARVSQDDVSADLGWVFDVSDQTQLTANVGLGFRAPNVFDLGTLGERPGNRFNIPNPELGSEHITQLDLGVRHRGDRWEVDAVVFALHYTDRIASVLTGDITPDGRDVTQSRNIDTADIAGIEIGAKLDFTPSLTAEFVLNYLRGEQTGAGGLDEPGDRIPPLNGRIGLQYQWTDTILLEPFLVFADAQDRLSARDVRDNRINPDGTPGWMTANIRAVMNVGDTWQFTAQLENILDKRYRVHGSGIDSAGRNLYLSARMGW